MVVARSTLDDGAEIRWEAFPGKSGAPRLDRTEVAQRQLAYLGITSRTMTRELAESKGGKPWQGAYLRRVVGNSAASRAGLAAGDILLRVGATEVTSSDQLTDWIQTQARPGEPFEVEFLRGSEDKQVLTATVTPDSREVSDSFTESFPLETSPGVLQYTGLQIAELSPELAANVYGTDEPVVMITGTIIGSAAYQAGFRGGDRIVTCDGRSITSGPDDSRRRPRAAHRRGRRQLAQRRRLARPSRRVPER